MIVDPVLRRPPEPSPPRRLVEHLRGSVASAAVALGGAALVTLYFLLPDGTPRELCYTGIGLTTVVVMAVAVWRRRPAERLGWCLLIAAVALFVQGDAVYTVYELFLHREAPFPSIADALYLAGYPLLFWGFAQVTRLRSAPGAGAARVDAAMVSLGAMAVSWQLLMVDYAHDSALSWFGKLVSLAYPVMDLGLLFIIVSAMMVRAARRPADALMGLAVAVMVVADFIYDQQVLHSTYTGGTVDGLFLANYVLMAAASVHPSVAKPLSAPSERPIRPVWLALVAVAALVAPVLLLACTVAHVRVDVTALASISIALSALAVLRAALLFRRLHYQKDELAAQGESLHAALAAQRALEEDLRHQAFHDVLTGLANRGLLHDRVEHALATAARRPGTVALCLCDLDGFKAVNDGMGHQAGDELLVVASKRIASVVRAGDTVARLGGDEFAVLVSDVDDPATVAALAERIVSVLRQPVTIHGRRVYFSASVGVAFAEPDSTTERLLAEADAAMYEAKRDGKDRVAVFESRMRARILDRMAMTNAFQTSLRDGRFYLQYQPQIQLADGTLEGFEALVRWDHPELGAVGPARFVPIAEETGFIVPLGRWVLQQACAEAARWERSGRPLSVSVNVSGRQLQDSSICDDVRDALAASGLPAQLLILEFTETVLMSDGAATAAALRELKRAGVRLAIDDFGTGYSSLSTLREFPADILKIDKSFIDPLVDPTSEACAFVQMILRLAADLGLEATAEGIEYQAQRDLLTELNCHGGQGYLMSRPLGVEDAREFLLGTADRVAGAGRALARVNRAPTAA